MEKYRPMVDILLATYNGAIYLDTQIESIVCQTYTNWRIIARDDGSSDNTRPILEAWSKKLGSRFLLLSEAPPINLGVIQNFQRLMEESTADYIAFCDQDDYWLDIKLERFVSAMEKSSLGNSHEIPLLAFSDLMVVDEELNIVNESFWQYQKIDPSTVFNMRKLAISNCVTGCAMMINRAALQRIVPMDSAYMHDWWIALCVANMGGHFLIIPDKTIKYRQHIANTVGARRATLLGWIKKGMAYLGNSSEFEKCYLQARRFYPFSNRVSFFFQKIILILERTSNAHQEKRAYDA